MHVHYNNSLKKIIFLNSNRPPICTLLFCIKKKSKVIRLGYLKLYQKVDDISNLRFEDMVNRKIHNHAS